MRRQTGKIGEKQDGASLLEFSLVAFMFIIVMLGVAEMGRMLLVYTTIADAARAGVRYAIVHGGDRSSGASGPGSTTNVVTVVQNYSSIGLMKTTNPPLTVAVSYPNGNAAGQPVQVTVTYVYDPLVSWFSSKLNVTMGSTSKGIIVY